MRISYCKCRTFGVSPDQSDGVTTCSPALFLVVHFFFGYFRSETFGTPQSVSFQWNVQL